MPWKDACSGNTGCVHLSHQAPGMAGLRLKYGFEFHTLAEISLDKSSERLG